MVLQYWLRSLGARVAKPIDSGRTPMRWHHAVRHVRWLLVLVPTVSLAQLGAVPLAPPPQPPGNVGTPAKENLGKALFWDEQLSSSRTVACGTCHHAKEGGLDPRATTGSPRATHPAFDGVTPSADDVTGSPGVPLEGAGGYAWSPFFGMHEQVTKRRTMSHIDAGYPTELFWDGRADQVLRDPLTGAVVMSSGAALEVQALVPIVSSVEMGHLGRDWLDATSRVATSVPLALATDIPAALETWIGTRTYPELFEEAFGTPEVTPVRIAMAVASYQRTLYSNQTPLDSALAGIKPLTTQENSGRTVFNQNFCGLCHRGALVADNAFNDTGVRPAHEDSGRAAVTHHGSDVGKFRHVSLRNVGLRHSFMHNGRFQTLEQVVDFYDRGGDFANDNKSTLILPIGLTAQQKANLLAFLRRPLTDPRVAAGSPPFDEPRLYGESDRVPQVLSGGVPGIGGIPQVVALEPPVAGNPSFTVGIYDGCTGAEAVLVIDDVEPPTGGGIPASGSLARVSISLLGAAADDGFGSASLAIPSGSDYIGRTFFGRWYVVDPAATGGVAASPSFTMTVFAPRGGGTTSVPSMSATAARVLQLHPGRPNPFASSTVIHYELFVASSMSLTIYDITGRAVRELARSPWQPAGAYAVEWDGRDDQGRVIAGGVYFSRLDAAGASARYRMVRLN